MQAGDWKVLASLDLPRCRNISDDNIEEIRAPELKDIEIYNLRYDTGEARNVAKDLPGFGEAEGELC
ncbi:MAG: hypothetical protein AAGB46_18035 [Verrucomicrobiota bacterium]